MDLVGVLVLSLLLSYQFHLLIVGGGPNNKLFLLLYIFGA